MLQPGTPEYEQAKGFVEQWKLAAAGLEEQRVLDIRATDTARDIGVFDDVLDYALAHSEPRTDSGLVEMQRIFMRAYARQGA